MASVPSAGFADSAPPGRETNPEHSPSRFTAVNGKDASVPGIGGSYDNVTVTATGPSKAEPRSGPVNDPRESGRNSPSQESEQTPQPVANAVQDASRPSVSIATAENYRGEGAKRKRSESRGEQEAPRSPDLGPSDARSAAPRIGDNVERHAPNNASDVPSTYRTLPNPSSAPLSGYSGPDGRGESHATSSWQDHHSHLVAQAQRAQQIDTTDAQLAQALQRETEGHESARGDLDSTGRPTDSSLHSEQSTPLHPYTQERPQPTVQAGPKRKRVFSNRTKTGCLTCRRRKKKCDEQRPACNNCLRGSFVCEGYSSRSTWQKSSTGTKTPVPLQSKEGYADCSTPYLPDASQPRNPPTSHAAEAVEPTQTRPAVGDEHERAAPPYSASPTGIDAGRGSWSKRGWPANSHQAYVADHLAKNDYREVAPIHELPRDAPSRADYQVVPPIREFPHGAPAAPGMPLFTNTMDQRPTAQHMNGLDPSTPQAQARLALSIEHQLSRGVASGDDTEKDKMLRGDLYRPFDVQLVEERDRCKAALWRFNNASNPLSGVSVKEQHRLLKEIFVPPISSTAGSPVGAPSPRSSGFIGQGAVVEAPFRCHYGYNIHIGEDVMVSENCLFVDDCTIRIGAHTWIGPNVTILSAMAHGNMQERKGSQSRYQGRSVTIEEDCYVGAGCTIYPGVRLRRGAYVAPGEVVKTEIVAYGFQGLKPSYM